MALVRELIGEALREERQRQGRTLRDVALGATMSLGYVSEVERGVKEPSSECLAALCSSLDMPLSSLLLRVSRELRRSELSLTSLPTDEPVAGEVAAA